MEVYMLMYYSEINRFRDEYAWLSNMYGCDIIYDGHVYPSVENAYQAAKCKFDVEQQIFYTCSPRDAKRFGRNVRMKEDFEANKISIMLDIVRVKFTQNNYLKGKLVDTYPAKIIEGNTWNDHFWGVCNGYGENKLGLCIMKVRDEIMSQM